MSDLPTPEKKDRRKKGTWRFLFRSDSHALDLVATVAGSKSREKGIDRFATPVLLERWLCEAKLPPIDGPITEPQLAATVALREAIFRLADSRLRSTGVERPDIDLINDHARTGVPVPRIAADGYSTEVPAPALLEELLGLIARDAVEVFTGAYRDRIKQCASPKCHVIFVDRSRNGTRRWCAMSPCGDQASAHAYRLRQKD